jgi:hypothetical protein
MLDEHGTARTPSPQHHQITSMYFRGGPLSGRYHRGRNRKLVAAEMPYISPAAIGTLNEIRLPELTPAAPAARDKRTTFPYQLRPVRTILLGKVPLPNMTRLNHMIINGNQTELIHVIPNMGSHNRTEDSTAFF